MVAQGGFGRIFKAIHLKSRSIVAIKERKSENVQLVNAWNEEIEMLKMIDEKVPQLFTSRFICSVDDQSNELKNKYVVMEWIDGKSLSSLLFSLKNSQFTFNLIFPLIKVSYSKYYYKEKV